MPSPPHRAEGPPVRRGPSKTVDQGVSFGIDGGYAAVRAGRPVVVVVFFLSFSFFCGGQIRAGLGEWRSVNGGFCGDGEIGRALESREWLGGLGLDWNGERGEATGSDSARCDPRLGLAVPSPWGKPRSATGSRGEVGLDAGRLFALSRLFGGVVASNSRHATGRQFALSILLARATGRVSQVRVRWLGRAGALFFAFFLRLSSPSSFLLSPQRCRRLGDGFFQFPSSYSSSIAVVPFATQLIVECG